MLLLHVDDSCVFGDREDINWLIEKMEERFKTKVEGGLNDFLGCDILRQEGV